MVMSLQLGRPPLPKEHGGWAMMLTPPIVALLGTGLSPLGLMAMLGWMVAYCMRGPVEALLGEAPTGRAGHQEADPAVARFWLVAFGLVAALLLGPVVVLRPWTLAVLLGALGFLGLVLLLAERGQTRSMAAGLLAVAGLMFGGPLYYLAAYGTVGARGWTLALAGFAFFAGSVFRVKTLARERRSPSFKAVSIAVHVGFVAASAVAAWVGVTSWLVALSLVPALVWSIYCAMRSGAPVSLAVVGRGEQWLTILFGMLLAIALRV
jgi:hypothetical protein